MRKIPAFVFAILISTLFSAPLAAQQPAFLQIAAPEPISLQGQPADFPGQGNVCRIPPPFQRESCICPLFFDPVCGCDGQTYSNACFAQCEVFSFTPGACDGGGA